MAKTEPSFEQKERNGKENRERRELRRTCEDVAARMIQVIKRPDDGDGEDWWVGFFHEDTSSGFWDTSSPSEACAHECAKQCRAALVEELMEELA